MSDIKIKTYEREDDIVRLNGKVVLPSSGEEITIPEDNYLNLFNYPMVNGQNLKPREKEKILLIQFKIEWEKGASLSDFERLVDESERAYNTLQLRSQCFCKESRWCSEQKKISLLEIGLDLDIKYEIPLNEVRGKVYLSLDITREITLKKKDTFKSTESYSIVSSANPIRIQIDEVKDVGGNYLPIKPEHIGDYVFELFGFTSDLQLPVIRYSEDLKDQFTDDNSLVTSSTFLASMPHFLDYYLKWLIFISRYDPVNKNQKGLIELFSRYCSVSQAEIVKVLEEDKYSKEAIEGYLNLSLKLFKGFQLNKDFKYKKDLLSLYKKEANLFL